MTYRQVNNINVFAPSQAVFSPTFTEEETVAVEVGGNCNIRVKSKNNMKFAQTRPHVYSQTIKKMVRQNKTKHLKSQILKSG